MHFCPYTPLILVGLKSDLRTKRTCIDLLKTQGLTPVTQEQGMSVARKMGAKYMECSSKEMNGVDDIFVQAIKIVVSNDSRHNSPKEERVESRHGKSNSRGGESRHSAKPSQGGDSGIVKKRKKRNCAFL